MNVSLSGELEQFIDDRVKSGKYSSAEAVIEDALWLLRERSRLHEERLAELKEKIRIGIEASERGEVVDGEKFFNELEEDSLSIEEDMKQKEKGNK